MAGVGREETLEDIQRFYLKGREWLKKSHGEGISGEEYGQSYSALMDSVIQRLFQMNHGHGKSVPGTSLVALGGYGREELSPFSDIDLLLLHPPGKGRDLGEWLRGLLYPLWDWGLTVGYTVQTPKESWRAAQKDFELCLSFLDARWVAGEKAIYFQSAGELCRSLSSGKGEKVILQICQRAEARNIRYGDSVFVLEPEVKEGKGGLRDYHSALSAAKLKYHIHSAAELTDNELLTIREWETYRKALGFLWRVRNQLHYFHGRREDRLSFEDQEDVARTLGYRAESPLLATESFLKDYFVQAVRIHRLSWSLLEKCLNGRPGLRPPQKPSFPAEILPGFFIFHGKLTLADPLLFDRNPFHLWEAFKIVHEHGVELDPLLQETITEHLDVVGERFRAGEESVRSFLPFFERPGHLFRVLEAMHESGFLGKFIPEFDRVHCHVQYDRYHIYPVDVHSFYAVRELELLERKAGEKSWPLLRQLMAEVKNPGLLKLAALVHDLGKAEGPSHALRGEQIAASIAERLLLPAEKVETLQFLVREHLTFSEIAQRRDLSDENLIFRFAQTIGDSERLRMLYLLSFADLRAVGPSAWTAWKDTLMRELFLKTLHLLEKGEGLGQEAREQVVNIQAGVMELLLGQMPAPKVSEYLVSIPPRHYAVNDSRSIAQQILMAEKLVDQTVVLEGEEKAEEGCDEVTVVGRDEPGLFAKISGVMAVHSLNILSALVSTWESGLAVDVFRVQNLIDEPLFGAPRWTRLKEDMEGVLRGRVTVESLIQQRAAPLFQRYPAPRVSTRVDVDNSGSDFFTILEVFTHDRPGLLYRVAQKIFEMGLSIWMAKISTKVDQVVDTFYVQDLSGAKVQGTDIILKMKNNLIEELERF